MSFTPPYEFHPQLHSSNIRRTSKQSYQRIVEGGLLSTQRMKVYVCLWEAGEPMTGTEINTTLRGKSYHKRLSELQRLGVIEEVGTRYCRVTGHECVVWDVTGNLPEDAVTSRPTRPTPNTIKRALQQVKAMEHAWIIVSPDEDLCEEFSQTMKWLGFLARKKER